MPAFIVIVKDVDPEATRVDDDIVSEGVEKEIAQRGSQGFVKAIEIPFLELVGGEAACAAIAEAAPPEAGSPEPLVSLKRKLGQAREDLRGETEWFALWNGAKLSVLSELRVR